ncbi:MFS transporter [Bradyrhizobium canariense]|uniref:Predicted arabinose efflux permease, MFS family n=1 Tax=Bradyrhizobium canariense TaxID=255045 RepID=A0A1H1ZF39_9BRAD|nr:MFS transporter [Bradyrhizobium canariense]SDT32102.1 Predicted arabinose efflux permease, MFS family [Bradyrhizobium canariense]
MTDSICLTSMACESGQPTSGVARDRGRFVLGRRASFWVSAGVVAHTLWTSAAPAMVYRIYAEEWHLALTTTTAIFAIYPIVVVLTLLGFGDLSDHIGHRATMLIGLAMSLAGVFAFAVAPDVAWLFAGRALMGIGVGLTASPSTAAMVEFAAEGQSQRAASVAAAAQAVGFAAALLLGGALIEYAPHPTRLPFWFLFAILAMLFVASWGLPRQGGASADRWRIRTPSVPPNLRGVFALASLAVLTAYTHGVLILSLGGQVAHDLVGSSNAFVNGAILSLFAIVSGIVGVAARRLDPRMAMASGAFASAAGVGLLALASACHALPIFLVATATAGTGYSLLFFAGLALINRAATPEHRGGIFAALYLVAYLSMGTVALVLGVLARSEGLGLAIDVGAGVIALLSLAAFGYSLMSPKFQSDAETGACGP